MGHELLTDWSLIWGCAIWAPGRGDLHDYLGKGGSVDMLDWKQLRACLTWEEGL